MAYVYATYAVHVTVFNTGGKFHPVSNFIKLHTLTLAAHSYTFLVTHDALTGRSSVIKIRIFADINPLHLIAGRG